MRFWLLSILILLPCMVMAEEEYNPDPWEGFNRAMFSFNQGLDRYFLRPVAVGYHAIVPKPVDNSVSHFFSNIDDIRVIVNDVAQLKFGQAASDTARFLINSTLGFFGLFDVATHLGLEKHHADFGLTLGYWGVENGPYLMLPFFGPSTVRDTGGLAMTYASRLSYLDMGVSADEGLALTFLYGVSVRSQLLGSESLMTGDQYTFIRSYYLQRRAFLLKVDEEGAGFEDDSWEDFDE